MKGLGELYCLKTGKTDLSIFKKWRKRKKTKKEKKKKTEKNVGINKITKTKHLKQR